MSNNSTPTLPEGTEVRGSSPSLKFHFPQIRFFGASPTLQTTKGAGKSCLTPIRAPIPTA